MKILHVINSLRCGGAERLLTWLLPAMKREGVESVVFVLSRKDTFFLSDLEKAGITVKFSSIRSLYSLLQIRAVRKEILENKYDLVHVHLFPAQLWSSIAISGTKIPLVTTEHSTSNRRRNKRIFRLVDSCMYSRMEKVICISNATRENLCNWVPKICSKTTVIYNGIEIRKFSEAIPYEKDQLGLGLVKSDKIILMVSRFSPQKDQDTVVRAISLLPDQFHVLFVGDGERKEIVESLVDSLNLSDRVHFLGNRSDVPRIMKTADVLVQSSHWEGFGLTVVEAMASGLPAIGTNIPGLREVLFNRTRMFDVGDSRKLAHIIREICCSLSEIPLNSEATLSTFSTANMNCRYISEYETIMRRIYH